MSLRHFGSHLSFKGDARASNNMHFSEKRNFFLQELKLRSLPDALYFKIHGRIVDMAISFYIEVYYYLYIIKDYLGREGRFSYKSSVGTHIQILEETLVQRLKCSVTCTSVYPSSHKYVASDSNAVSQKCVLRVSTSGVFFFSFQSNY